MVKMTTAAIAISLSFAGVITLSPAVRAQSVLEQMETEVATIAAKTKSAVVTISDDRAFFPQTAASGYNYRVERVYEAPEETKKRIAADAAAIRDLGVAYTNLDYAETGERSKLKKLLEKYVAKAPVVLEQQEKVNVLKKRMTDTLTKLNARKAASKNAQITQYRVFRSSDSPAGQDAAPRRIAGTKTGTGFSIGDGYIVTTVDVLDGMRDLLVTTDGGTQVRAQIVGVNREWNVGLLKLAAKVDLPALTLGDSSKVAVGHFAISVGEQSGQSNSVALLLVGGLRTDGVNAGGHFYPNLIQLAGTVGAGISGAPLVNSRGEVIGIMAGVPAAPQSVTYSVPAPDFPAKTTLDAAPEIHWSDGLSKSGARGYKLALEKGATPKKDAPKQNRALSPGAAPLAGSVFGWQTMNGTGGNTVYPVQMLNGAAAPGDGAAAPVTSAGFAVPINALKPILDELKSGKAVAQGWIGISPKDEETWTEAGFIVTANHRVLVEAVYPASPAFLAGMRPGDIIASINGKPVQSANDVRELSQGLRPGAKLKMAYLKRVGTRRDSMEVELNVTARPAVVGEPLLFFDIKNGKGD